MDMVDGRTFLPWKDVWNNYHMSIEFPILFSYAQNQSRTLQQYLANPDVHDVFRTPLSVEEIEEYIMF